MMDYRIYIVLIALVLIAYLLLLWLPHDNLFEQLVELLVKKETGLDIDISPDN